MLGAVTVVKCTKIKGTPYIATKLTPEEKKLAEQFAEDRKLFLKDGLLPAAAAVRAGDLKLATDLLHGPMEARFQPVRRGINDLIQLQLDVAKQEYEARQDAYLLIRNSCIAAVVVGLIFAAFIGVWLLRSITRPLDDAVRIAGAIADGDLTQPFPASSNDEMGRLIQALKNMNDSLMKIVVQVRTGTDTIATASSQIAAGNSDLSSRTEEQASSLEETASSMEELTSTVKQNADNANQANTLALAASGVASKGGVVVSEVVATMSSINDASKKIVDIIGVIDGIAFQTNILALNAAVEAARAGEQGRGFAVVAAEVRNLAQRSAGAAKEIKSLIDASVGKVEVGAKLVEQAGSTMQEIVDSVKRVSDIVSEISAASREQTQGIEQINQAIVQMDQVTQQNASLVEEAAAASESMRNEAKGLADTVAVFKVSATNTTRLPRTRVTTTALPTRERATANVTHARVTRLPAPRNHKSQTAAADGWTEF